MFHCNKCYNIFGDSSKSHSKVFKLVSKEIWFFLLPFHWVSYISVVLPKDDERTEVDTGLESKLLPSTPPMTLRIKMQAERQEAMGFQLPRTTVWAHGEVKYCEFKGSSVEGKVKLFRSGHPRKLTRLRKLIKLQDSHVT